ncbi:NUDIX hydrolase [Candidatus Woesearchaeota archaeon]|nr:NUDIX hydrolase [Candidatus Woesearchaeota archaeon]
MSHEEFIKYPTGKISKGDFCSHCGKFNSRQVCYDVLAVWDKKILLIQRKQEPAKGYWALPGGYVDWDETAEECARREFKEETGCTTENLELLGIYSDPKRDDGRQNVTLCYLTRLENNPKTKFDKEEISDLRWFSLDDLPEKLAFDHKDMIQDYKNQVKQ